MNYPIKPPAVANVSQNFKTQPTQIAQKKLPNHQQTRANSAEELAASVRIDNSKEKKLKSSLKSNFLIKKRIERIEKIRNIEELLLKNQDVGKLARNISQCSDSMAKLNDLLFGEKESGTVLMYVALEKASNDQTLPEKNRFAINEIKADFLEEHNTQILSWKYSVDQIKQRIADPDIANSVLSLIGKSNHNRTGYLEVYNSILGISGEQNFSKVATAYSGALMDDLSHKTTSADSRYLSFTLGKVNDIASANTAFILAKEGVTKLKDKYSFVEKTNVDFLQAILHIMQNPKKENIENIAMGFLGIGIEKKYDFLGHAYALVKQLPNSIWVDKEQKSNIMLPMESLLIDYADVFSTPRQLEIRREIKGV